MYPNRVVLFVTVAVPLMIVLAEAKHHDAGAKKVPTSSGRRSPSSGRVFPPPPPPHDKNPVMQNCWYQEAVSPSYDDEHDSKDTDRSGLTRPVSSSSKRRITTPHESRRSIIDSLRGGSATAHSTSTTEPEGSAESSAATSSTRSLSSLAMKASSKLSLFVARQAFGQAIRSVQKQMQMIVAGELTLKEAVLTFGVMITVIAALISMTLLDDNGGFFSLNTWLAWSCIILGPLAAVLQRKVFILQDLRDITDQMSQQVLQLQTSNAKLQLQNQRLQENTERLQNTQMTLEQISQSQGMSIETLVEQVQEYKEIRSSIHSDIRGRIQNIILNVMERSDKDMDYVIDEEEMDQLISNLKLLPGVAFDEQKLRTALSSVKGDLSDFFDRHVSIHSQSQIFQLL